jgi:hypothetical protein
MSEPTPIESDDDEWYWNGEDLVRLSDVASDNTGDKANGNTNGKPDGKPDGAA